VNITWVFFRAGDFATAWRMLRSMLLLERGGAPVLGTYFVSTATTTVAAMLLVHWYMRHRALHVEVARLPAAATGVLWGAMLFAIAITQGGSDAFIYFQF
ncbi:MAG: MBOAT family protein, partial [Gammaproteobacteria bacterium]|nr:MBOAT family protein [Gammaproteobacteria bacterium]